MYDAVFSALMTLMGLSFAAIGLLLQAKEKHWVRHAHIWRSIRWHFARSAVAIFLSSVIILWIMEAESNTTYSLTLWGLPESESSMTYPLSSWTWWLVLFLFGVSLASLWLLIHSAIKNLQEENILKRMREKHFSDELGDISDAKVKEFFAEISQLLTATLDVGDLATYEQILDIAIVDVAGPRERNGKSIQESIRINNQGKIACGGLRQLRAQIDFSMDNPVAARATSSACLVATKQIVDSWADLDPKTLDPADYEADYEAAKKSVIEHAVEDFGFVAEFLLSAPMPSLSLVTEAAGICKSLSAGASDEEGQKSAERVLNGSQRALSAGYSKEALILLDAIRPWLNRSWKFIPTLVRLSVVGQKDSTETKKFADLFDGLRVDANSLSIEDIGLLAPVLVEVLSDLSQQTQPKLRNSFYRLVSRVASTLNKTEGIRVFLNSVESADDEIFQQFVQRFILDTDVAPDFYQLLTEFFGTKVESYGLGPVESVEKLCQLVYPVGRAIAKGKPERIFFLQGALVGACRNLGAQTDVNPIFATLNAACAVEERFRLLAMADSSSDPILTGDISYYPDIHSEKKPISIERPPRSQWNKWVEHCHSTMKAFRDERRDQNLDHGFSGDLRRRFLVSVAHLVVDLEFEARDIQRAVLLDEKILTACELSLSWDLSDAGDVTASLTWIRDSAALVFADSLYVGRNEEILQKRWGQVFLLSTGALASEDNALSDIFKYLHVNAEELINERLTNPRVGAARTMSTSYEDFETKTKLVTAAQIAESRSENPEEEIHEACSNVDFQTPEMQDEFCARLLTAVAKMRIPKWADETRELSTKCAMDGSAKNAYYLLRVVRSCLRKDDWGMVFHPEGLFYVFNKRGRFNKNKEGLTSKDSSPWIFDVVEALARDWLAYKYKEDSEESKKKVAEILTSINDELNRLRVTSVPKNFRTSIREWSKNGNSTPHTDT
jgi:hypothetical protein